MMRLDMVVERHRAALREEVAMLGREPGKVLKKAATLMIKDVMKFTPPFSEATSQESWRAQQLVGMNAVRSQILKTQRPIKDIRALDGNAKWQKALRSGDAKSLAGVENFLKNIGFAGARVINTADPSWHHQWRDSRGRVRRKPLNVFVTSEASLKRYIKMTEGHVGQAKAGWLPAARGAGVKGIPQWIAKHTMPGEWIDESEGLHAKITVGNQVPYIQAAGRDLKIIERAMENRTRNTLKEIDSVLKSRLAASAKRRAAASEMASRRLVSAMIASQYRAPIRITPAMIAK